jgi:hypothetical protein
MLRSVLIVALFFAASNSLAQTIYKHVDEKGRVTYSNEPPAKRIDGSDASKAKVKPVTITESTKGIEPAGKTGLASAKAADDRRSARGAEADKVRGTVDEAQRELDAAKKAQADGKDPLDSEWQQAGTARIPSEAFTQRQQKLAEAVKAAEAKLEASQQSLRKAQ